SRDPESIVKVCSLVAAPPTYRLRATAAIGNPDSTMYAPSHPAPSVDTALLNSGLSLSVGASALAPSFMSWIARTNRNRATANEPILNARPSGPRPAGRRRRSAPRAGASVPPVTPGSATVGTRSSDDHDRARRVVGDVLAHAPEQRPRDAADTPVADDDEVDLVTLGHAHQGAFGTTHRHLADRLDAEARHGLHGGPELRRAVVVGTERPLLVASSEDGNDVDQRELRVGGP